MKFEFFGGPLDGEVKDMVKPIQIGDTLVRTIATEWDHPEGFETQTTNNPQPVKTLKVYYRCTAAGRLQYLPN